jgi:hypothetical protein
MLADIRWAGGVVTMPKIGACVCGFTQLVKPVARPSPAQPTHEWNFLKYNFISLFSQLFVALIGFKNI